jgi:TonB family protein
MLDATPRPVDGVKSLGALAEYPDLAVRAGIGGVIQVQVVLDEEGIPRDMRILRSDGEILTESSIQAVRKSSFAPAVFRGKRVPAAVAITFRYSLLEEPRVDVNISEVEFHELSGMIGPRYHLTFRRNGTAEYDGSGFMDMTGLHVGTIPGDDFYRLSLILGWFCFLDTSSRTSFLGISDGWEEHVRVLWDGQWVERRFDGGDERVWGMARLMEACARTITWSKME